MWRDNKCREAAGHRSAAPGQQENWSAHFRSHLCRETSPGRRLLRADRDAPKGRGRVVGGLRGRTTAPYTSPVLQQCALILICLIDYKHMMDFSLSLHLSLFHAAVRESPQVTKVFEFKK